MTLDNDMPALGPNDRDRSAAVFRALTGLLPGGSILGEVFSIGIPGQRQDRFEAYLRLLDARLNELGVAVEALRSADSAEIVEDGCREAVNCVHRERVHQIANAVAYGIASDPSVRLHREIVRIVAQVDPEDIAILVAMTSDEAGAFSKLKPLALPPDGGTEELRAAHAMWEASLSRMSRLGLIEYRQRTEEFDLNQGKVGYAPNKILISDGRRGHWTLLRLGREVLQAIGPLGEGPRR